MILQRLASAIRNQNWSQIITEILIVVIGIFLGLQVQATYEEQQDRKLEKIYLQRLLDDADISVAVQERNIIRGEEKIGGIEKAYQLMINQQVSEDNREEFTKYFNNIRGVYSMDVYLTTIDELVASGQVTLIQSQKIREAIGLLRKEYEILDRSQHDLALATLRLSADMFDLIYMDEAGETILNPLEDFDRVGIILRKFRTIRDLHNRFHGYNISIRDLTKEYKAMVLDELEKFQ